MQYMLYSAEATRTLFESSTIATITTISIRKSSPHTRAYREE